MKILAELKVQSLDLQRALSVLGEIKKIDSYSSKFIEICVYLDVRSCYLHVNNDKDICVRTKLMCAITQETVETNYVSVIVGIDEFEKAFKCLCNETTVTLQLYENSLTVISEGVTTAIEARDKALPFYASALMCEREKNILEQTVDLKSFVNALKIVKDFVATDDLRPATKYIYTTLMDYNNAEVVATNGRVLCIKSLCCKNDIRKFSFLLAPIIYNFLNKLGDAMLTVRYFSQSAKVEFKVGRYTIQYGLPDYKYIQYKPLIYNNFPIFRTVNKFDLIEGISKIEEGEIVRFNSADSSNMLILEGMTWREYGGVSSFISSFGEGKLENLCYAVNDLSQLLFAINGNSITLNFLKLRQGEEKMLSIGSLDETFYSIMLPFLYDAEEWNKNKFFIKHKYITLDDDWDNDWEDNGD